MALPKLEEIQTGYYDIRGVPICVGDLLKIYHFTAARYRRKVYMYRLVVRQRNRFMLVAVTEIGFTGTVDLAYTTELVRGGAAEVVDGLYCENQNGDFVGLFERERVAP